MDVTAFLVIGFLSWFFGSVAAGGAGLIFLIASSFFLPLSIIPIILAVVGSLSGAYRFFLYRSSIKFEIAKWLLIGTILGTVIGTNIFASLIQENQIHIIEIILSLVLIASGFYGLLKSGVTRFKAKGVYFLPVSLGTSILSSIIGAGSPLINILFQRTNLNPVEIVGTKSFSNFILQFSKLVMYAIVLDYEVVLKSALPLTPYGFFITLTAATIGAIAGSYFSKKYLDRLDIKKFDWIINGSLIVFGVCFLIKSGV